MQAGLIQYVFASSFLLKLELSIGYFRQPSNQFSVKIFQNQKIIKIKVLKLLHLQCEIYIYSCNK